MRRTLGVAAFVLARTICAQAPVDPSQIEHRLHAIGPGALRSDSNVDLVARMRTFHVPGVSIAIVDGSRVVFERGYGVTEFGGSTAVDSTTLFQAGSISKPVFATGVLALVQEGRLSLDEDVNRRLTTWHVPATPFTAVEKVTLRRILTHTAGLTVHGFPGYAVGTPIPTIPQVLDGQPPANTPAVRNDTTPGARYSYSGGGITIAQLLTMDVTHERFPDLMQRLVLKPAGMTRSTYENPLPERRRAEAAAGQEQRDTPVSGRWHVYPEMAAAGLWTTSADLARWAITLSAAYNGESRQMLSTTSARQMVSHQVDVKAGCRAGWGLGVAVDGAGADLHFSHGGRDEGFVAIFDMWPVRGQGIFVLTNGVSDQLLAEIVNAFRQMYGIDTVAKPRSAIDVDPGILDRYVAGYRFAPNATLTVTREAKRLFGQLTGQPRFELFPESERAFFLKVADAQVTFEVDGAARTTALVVDQGGCRTRAARIDQ